MRLPLAFAAVVLGSACSAAESPSRPAKIVVYGDSISITGGGWPAMLEARLAGAGTIVESRAINGNALLWRTRCFGEPALERLRADLPQSAKNDILVLMAGANDLIQPRLPRGYSDCFDPGELGAAQIIAALAPRRRPDDRPRILLATIPPFGASEFHSAGAEGDRRLVNQWILANWPAGDVIDLDSLLAERDRPQALSSAMDSGDGLHPNERGAAAIAKRVGEVIKG
jgi:lysophospholipase L1-like esterase